MHQGACVLLGGGVHHQPGPLHRMEELGLHPDDGQVCFGQLLGMCDQISFPLGELCCPGCMQGVGGTPCCAWALKVVCV